jgi:hypothetical protein
LGARLIPGVERARRKHLVAVPEVPLRAWSNLERAQIGRAIDCSDVERQ